MEFNEALEAINRRNETLAEAQREQLRGPKGDSR